MATQKFDPKQVSDRTAYSSDLIYMPTDYKESKVWVAQNLFVAKQRAVPFLDSTRAALYRKTDNAEIDELTYRKIFDPPTNMQETNFAPYVSADFKAMPVDQHLKNIVEASIRKVIASLVVKVADPVAKLREQKDKEKIILQRFYRNIINDINKELGLPPLREGQDPYKYMESFQGNGKDTSKMLDEAGNVIDQIRLKIKDEDGLRLFMQYLYKNGIEIAFEAAIKFYLIQQNEWQAKWGNYFFTDIRHFNKYCGEWTIDEMTGRGQVGYIPPEILYTSPFKDKNGDDILFYFYEESETWANFERLVGAEMSDVDKQAVLKLQKERGSVALGYNYGTYQWDNNTFKNDYRITIGRYGVLTQDANAFSEKYINGEIKGQTPKPLDWEPEEKIEESKKVKCYNVWYTCYYIPIVQSTFSRNSPPDWNEQSKYIFKIEKVKDMYRYGADLRYAKPPLVIGQDNNKLSFTDILEAFMPKIHHEWHKFQNYSTQDFRATVFDTGLVAAMLNAVDDANKQDFNEDGKPSGKSANAVIDSWKMMRQAGQAPLNFRDKNGIPLVDPSKFIFNVGNDLMEKAIESLTVIAMLYNEMTKALAISDVGEGLQPKARTPLGGIEAALNANSNARWAIEQMYGECLVQFSKRVVQHVHCLCKEKKQYNYKERWDELNDVLGMANGATLESIEDIKLANIGLTVDFEDTTNKKELLITMATNLLQNKEINEATLGLILDADNWKLMIVILSMAAQEKRERDMEDAQLAHDRQMELGQQQLEIQQAMQGVKTQGKVQEIDAETRGMAALQQQLDALKGETQAQMKLLTSQLKQTENQQKAELKKADQTHEKNLESQTALV